MKGPAETVEVGRSARAPAGPRGRLRLLLETVRFPHTLFALPFAALAAVWAARGVPPPLETALLLVAMVAARTAAMAFNRVVDARFDAANPRTRERAIPAGRLSQGSVAVLAAGGAAVFIAAAAAFYPLRANPWPAWLCGPFLAVLLGYSYTKRFTALSHYVLGLALGLSPVGVWIALTGRLDWPPLALAFAVMAWTAGFDILYSLQDVRHDRELGLHSIAARLGAGKALMVARLNHAAMVLTLLAMYGFAARGAPPADPRRLGAWYLAGLALLAALLVYEHTLIRANDLRRLDAAFFTVNAVGSVVFAAFGILDVFL